MSDVDVAIVGDVDEASLIGDIARGLGFLWGVDVVNALKVSVEVLRNVLKHGVYICGDEAMCCSKTKVPKKLLWVTEPISLPSD